MWRPRYEETDDGQKGGRNGQSKQTLIGARPPMFTGLPAMPTSLARWFLADETREMLDFPVDIIKIGGGGGFGSGRVNKRFAWTFDPDRTSASAYIGLCRYQREGKEAPRGDKLYTERKPKRIGRVEWSRTTWNARSQMLGRAEKEPAGIVKFYRFDEKLPSLWSVLYSRLHSSFVF